MRKSILKLLLLCFLLLCPNSSENINAKNKNTELINITFINGNEIFKEEKIIKGTSVGSIESPKANADQTYFLGWHQNHLLNSPFDLSTPIHQSKTLYAKFSNEYTVSFQNKVGIVIDTISVKKNKKINPTQKDIGLAENEFLNYWYDVTQRNKPIFDFASTIVDRNYILAPEISTKHAVFFNMNGGNSINPESIEHNQTLQDLINNSTEEQKKKLSNPTRKGYKFTGWKVENKSIDNSYVIDKSIIINATWQIDKVGYKIAFWIEKPRLYKDPGTDIKNYTLSYLYENTNLKDYTNTEIEVSEAQARKILVDNKSNTTVKPIEQAFVFSHSMVEKLKGDGTTVIEVFMKRRIITLNWYLNRDTDSSARMTANGIEYVGGDKIHTYTGKFEDDISEHWPMDITSEKRLFKWWEKMHQGLSDMATKRTILDIAIVPLSTASANATIKAIWEKEDKPATTINHEAKYAFQSVEDTSIYEIDESQTNRMLRSLEFIQKNFDGFTSHKEKEYKYQNEACSANDYANCVKTIVFHYNRSSFDLSLFSNSGKFEDGKENKTITLKYQQKIPALPKPTRENYEFSGWYLDAGLEEAHDGSINTMPLGGLKLFAKWKAKEVTVEIFDNKTDTNALESNQVEINTSTEISTNYTKGKYYQDKGIFLGWYFNSHGHEFEFNQDMTIENDLKVYAKWQTNGFVVTYDLDGGNGTTPKDNNYYEIHTKAQVLNPGLVEKENKMLVGFKKDNDPKLYYPYEYIEITNNEHLTAVYAQKNDIAKVTYHHNLNDVNTIVNYMAIIDDKINLAGHIFDHDQYKLMGWSTHPNALEVEYDLESTITIPSTDINLYAVWKHHDLKVSFISDPGGKLDYTPINSGNDKSTYRKLNYLHEWTKEDSEKVPNVIADEGYRFVGWDPVLPAIGDALEDNYIFVAMFEQMEPAKITVIHQIIDENNDSHEVKANDEINTYLDEKYDLKNYVVNENGYELSEESKSLVTGQVSETSQTIILTYKKQAKVTINYVDDLNNSIDSKKYNHYWYESFDYNNDKKEIEGYTLLDNNVDLSGLIKEDEVVLTIKYARNTTLTIKYVNDEDTPLTKTNEVIDTYVGASVDISTYLSTILEECQYSHLKNQSDKNISIDTLTKEVIAVYNRQASVTINYVDQDNKSIHDPYVLNTYMNQSYDLSDKKLDLLPTYKYHAIDGDLTSNKITQLNTIITIKYLKQAKITINHIDDTNYTFKSSTIDTYYLSEEYDLNDYDFNIDNYDYKNVDQPLIGTLSDDLVINATYVRKAVLTINYLNDVNETIADSQTINTYTQEKYDLNTYKLENTDHQYSHELNGLENTGKISDTNFVINLVYNRPATVYIHHVDDTGNKIENVSSHTHNSYMNNAYDLSNYSKEISNHKYNKVKTGSISANSISALETHIELEYLRAAQIIINYIDDTNNQIKDQTIITGKYINDEYDLSNFDFAIDKYKLSTINGDLKASIKDEQIIINAYYNRQAKFTLNFVDENNKNIIDSIEDKTTYYINDDYDYSTLTEKFEDYFFIESSLELTGKVNDVNNEITLKYQRKEASITLKFTTKTRVKLADDVILDDYKINDDYDLTKYKDYLEHYEFVNSDIDLVGKVKNKETIIILIFSEIPAKVILVHQDENKKEIKEKDIHKTYLKRDYDFSMIAQKKSLDDYVFVKADKALQGIVEQPELKITLTYKKNTTNNNDNNSGNNNSTNNNNNSNNANNNKPSNSTNQSNNKTNDKNKDKQTNSNLKNPQTIKQNTPQTGSMLIIYTTCFILLSLLSIYLYKYYL